MKSGNDMETISCCIGLHNDNFFYLTLQNQKLYFGEAHKFFKKLTALEVKKNPAHIQRIPTKMYVE